MLTKRPARPSVAAITLLLLASDIVAVALSYALSFTLRRFAPFLPPLTHTFGVYLAAWPALLLWPLLIWREGMYPGSWLTVREELRRMFTATTLATVVLMATTFVTQTGLQFSRPILVGGWLISLGLLPMARFGARQVLTRLGLTGPRTVILGAGKTARLVLSGLHRQRPPALWPVALFDDDPAKASREIEGVPVIGPLGRAAAWAADVGVHTAIIAMPGVPRALLIPIVEEHSKTFQRIIVVPDLFGLSGSEMEPRDIQGVLALELRKNLLYPENRLAKRALELMILVITMPLVLLVSSLISLAVLVDSGRPVFFGQDRVGKAGRPFRAWKYRTMIREAEAVLAEVLERDAGLRSQWEATQKLQDDPRLTRVGRLLRRLSLDELPQLWNVVRGEMSLVGPRPILEDQIGRYGDSIDLYYQVAPGLTGLWQVSGRANTTFEARVAMDTHYVRNWSVWFDLVILVRTVGVALSGTGAY